MKQLMLCAALLLCSSAQAATYIYQANAYSGHEGRCGGSLLPFQVTITARKALPPNTTRKDAPLKTVAVNAGGKYQWGYTATKKHELGGLFVTDSNGDITEWNFSAATNGHRWFNTHNQPGSVEDMINFKCGGASVQDNPGTWTRTE